MCTHKIKKIHALICGICRQNERDKNCIQNCSQKMKGQR
jgi:hypothetical protein